MYDIFALYLQRGNIDVGFLGGTDRPLRQHQRHGDWRLPDPKVRLPGSGGSMEIAAWPTDAM